MSATETDSADLRRLKSGRDWHGYLTLENYEAVAQRLRELLAGHRYTFVAVNSGSDYRPEVRTGMELRSYGIRSHLNDDRTFASIGVADTYGSWGLHAFEVADQKAAHERRNAAWAKASEDDRRGWQWQDKRLTHAHIKHDRLEVEFFAIAGFRVYWTAVVEPEREVGE
jgi:hypothetical protein